jgi:hypothetical protein
MFIQVYKANNTRHRPQAAANKKREIIVVKKSHKEYEMLQKTCRNRILTLKQSLRKLQKEIVRSISNASSTLVTQASDTARLGMFRSIETNGRSVGVRRLNGRAYDRHAKQ